MWPPRCTIDTSCVIALDLVDLLPKLSFLFSAVLIPRAVRSELFRRRRTKDRIQALLRDYSFLQPCDEYDRGAADVLLVERAHQGVADRGETEAAVQAAAVGAAVVVDDPWGRTLAGRFGLDCHGSIWILRRLFQLGLISGQEVRSCCSRLIDSGIRLPAEGVARLLADSGEARLG